MKDYLKYSYLLLLFMPLTAVCVLAGGWWSLLAPNVVIAFHLIYDNLSSPDVDTRPVKYKSILNFMLYMHLPASLGLVFLVTWQATPGDFLGFGAWLSELVSVDLLQAHNELTLSQLLSSAFAVGFILSTNTLVGHELVHRTSHKLSMFVGRWLLAVVGDAQFSISHVYAHHLNVATHEDAATARRGESLYAFFFRSSIGQYFESCEIERRRLKNRGSSFWSWKNRVLTGALMTFAIIGCMVAIAGWIGLLVYVVLFLTSKFLFETVNYIEHYGLLREKGTKVEPKHSWDCNTRAASYVLYNLSRHSDHHARATTPFWELEAHPNVMDLKYGYIAHMMLAMVPPLWNQYTAPKLAYWDQNLATEAELELAKKSNLDSGKRIFKQSPSVELAEENK
ncbi:alkane 1-monooxygenase [Kangiella sediminilitoris]|uniref:Fatty acid desaturase n=1 Tax=Kangiella sediminilitoris TaxID=1144748 RepID=A0A1B3B928_9GAMM|nr:alkane 1-monooxygenase [Kangiella sediminilitoris]AOE49304.1 Fatty acid desaturase [Kangiella sediminilitoris]